MYVYIATAVRGACGRHGRLVTSGRVGRRGSSEAATTRVYLQSNPDRNEFIVQIEGRTDTGRWQVNGATEADPFLSVKEENLRNPRQPLPLQMRRPWVIKSGQAKRGNTLFDVGEGNMPVAFGREYVAI
jgi:hypothetical protein